MAGANTLEFSDNNFESDVLEASVPVVVDFWAPWCMPCKALGPVIDELASENAGKVKVGKMDTDKNNDVPVKYGIQSIPTVMVFKGGQVVQKFVGLKTKKELQAAIDAAAK